ncbi:MAG: LemA family protein [Candidatus Izemoplasmataceae bacterium]
MSFVNFYALNVVVYSVLGVIVLLFILIIAFLIKNYNILVTLRNKVRNSWSQIDVQLKRRFDMIPNLVETVKGYAKHESGIFTAFAEARTMYTKSAQTGDVAQAAKAEQGLAGALSRLVMVQEQYPELKANENFKELMGQLKDTEDKISYSRQFYNDTVMKLNTKIEMFPTNIVAGMFGFKQEPFFQIEDATQREAVKVNFS